MILISRSRHCAQTDGIVRILKANLTCNAHPSVQIQSSPQPGSRFGITHGDEIILTKYARGFAHYALVAGFTEIGETLEETVQREVMEEVGLKVKNIRYYKSQPWGIVDDILMGFFCDVDGDPTITMDQSELKLASWFKREEIVLQPDDFSLTNEMMCLFKNGKEPRA